MEPPEEQHQETKQLLREMQQMASRPFATINVALETEEEPPDLIGGNVKIPSDGSSLKCSEGRLHLTRAHFPGAMMMMVMMMVMVVVVVRRRRRRSPLSLLFLSTAREI
ncbi:Attractin DPPT-L [Takifugu flavidus]|uniref:Attractin DPPT-L n=1 Tax=Takifugu flavidus TaxID=433684 RepID=A0A5C6P0B9_9TELE|nr:Attractin DPPT-L [Takifugu flavidus]